MALLKNTILYTGGNLLISLSSFILLPIYTKFLTISDYGIVNSMQIFSSLLIIFYTLSFERSLVRVYHDYDNREKKIFAGTIIISILLISIFFILISFLLKQKLLYFFPNITFYPYFFYTLLYTLSLSVIGYSQTLFQVKQQVNKFLLVTIMNFFITTFLNIYFIFYLKEGAVGFVKGLFYGSTITLPFCFYLLNNEISYRFNFKMIIAASYFSLPMCINLIASWFLNLSDRIFINHYFNSSDVALYSVSNKLASIVSTGGLAVSMAYNPIFYSIANSKNLNSKDVIQKYQNIIIIALSFITLLVIMWSDIALKMFFREEYLTCYKSINILSIAFLIGQIAGLLNLMAYQAKKTKLVAIIVVVSALVNIILNVIFMKSFGYLTAVGTTLVCNFINFILLYIVVKKHYYVPLNWSLMFKIFSLLTLIILISNLINSFSTYYLIIFKLSITILIITTIIFKKQLIFNYLKSD